jgi:hypothetical protein
VAGGRAEGAIFKKGWGLYLERSEGLQNMYEALEGGLRAIHLFERLKEG